MQVLSYFMVAVVFAMWAFSVFRTLFALRARAVARTGSTLPGPVESLREWGFWLRDPAFKRDRRQLAFMTLCVLGLSAVFAFSGPAAP